MRKFWRRVQILRQLIRYLAHDEWFVYVILHPHPSVPGWSVTSWHALGVSRGYCESLATEVGEAFARRESVRQGKSVTAERI